MEGLNDREELNEFFDINDINGKKNKDLNKYIMEGKKAPRPVETLSDIDDPKERDAIFNHSIKDGVFRNINNSPLRERMPKSLQMY